jgi:hypothetical protein
MYFTYDRLFLPIPLPLEHTQIEHHKAFATMTKADLRKSNVIHLTQKTPAKKQNIDRKHLCQSNPRPFLNPKCACESVERVAIDISDDAIDLDADAVDRDNIVDTKVCAEMPTLDDSDHTLHVFSITPRKKPLMYASLGEEKTVGIAIVETCS